MSYQENSGQQLDREQQCGADPQCEAEQQCEADPQCEAEAAPFINTLSFEELESRIAMLSAHIQAATYRLLCLVGAFERRDGWSAGGFVSCAHWLAWRTGEDLVTAREKVRVARALKELPQISAAFARADLSYSKVRAITRIACPENEETLLVMAKEATASQLERIVRGARRAQATDEPTAQDQHEGRYLQYHYSEQGMLELRCRLPPEVGALVVKALEAATDALREKARTDRTSTDPSDNYSDNYDEVSYSQRLADALVLLAESALDHDLARGSRAERYQVVVHVDAETLRSKQSDKPKKGTTIHKNAAHKNAGSNAGDEDFKTSLHASAEEWQQSEFSSEVTAPDASAEELQRPGLEDAGTTPDASAEEWSRSELEDGVGLSAQTCRRLACEGSIVMLVEDAKGNPLYLGRKKRRLSAALTRALKSRDGGCQFPGCTHQRYVEAHHLIHWADGGTTDLENTTMLCSFHHHAVHEQGFRVKRDENGALIFFRPDGTLVPQCPEPLGLPKGSMTHLVQQHRHMELGITDSSGGPTEFTGAHFDLAWAVESVLPADTG